MAQDETRQGTAQHRDKTVYALLSEPERLKASKIRTILGALPTRQH